VWRGERVMRLQMTMIPSPPPAPSLWRAGRPSPHPMGRGSLEVWAVVCGRGVWVCGAFVVSTRRDQLIKLGDQINKEIQNSKSELRRARHELHERTKDGHR